MVWCRDVGVFKKVEGALVVNDQGRPVLRVTETTGVIVEDEQRVGALVRTAVREVELGNVLDPERLQQQQEQPNPGGQPAATVVTSLNRTAATDAGDASGTVAAAAAATSTAHAAAGGVFASGHWSRCSSSSVCLLSYSASPCVLTTERRLCSVYIVLL